MACKVIDCTTFAMMSVELSEERKIHGKGSSDLLLLKILVMCFDMSGVGMEIPNYVHNTHAALTITMP